MELARDALAELLKAPSHKPPTLTKRLNGKSAEPLVLELAAGSGAPLSRWCFSWLLPEARAVLNDLSHQQLKALRDTPQWQPPSGIAEVLEADALAAVLDLAKREPAARFQLIGWQFLLGYYGPKSSKFKRLPEELSKIIAPNGLVVFTENRFLQHGDRMDPVQNYYSRTDDEMLAPWLDADFHLLRKIPYGRNNAGIDNEVLWIFSTLKLPPPM
tara:strand:+ start:109 stop:753 length:645 start_codon:yes stop_codon:yes gene_type:complete